MSEEAELVRAVRANGVVHKQVACGNEFAQALCEHFGLSTYKVDGGMQIHSGADEIFAVTLKIYLAPDDLAEIAARMKANSAKWQVG